MYSAKKKEAHFKFKDMSFKIMLLTVISAGAAIALQLYWAILSRMGGLLPGCLRRIKGASLSLSDLYTLLHRCSSPHGKLSLFMRF